MKNLHCLPKRIIIKRRISAQALAQRLRMELGLQLGLAVGTGRLADWEDPLFCGHKQNNDQLYRRALILPRGRAVLGLSASLSHSTSRSLSLYLSLL